MLFRTAVTSGAILLGLAAAGALAGPSWDPVPMSDHIRPASRDTTIGGADGGFPGTPPPGTFEVRESPVTITLDDGATVGGLLREPVTDVVDPDASGQRSGTDTTVSPPDTAPSGDTAPGVVFVHGAGTGKAAEAFTEAATTLASAGVVTLVPDKYLANYSTRHRDYERMAADYERSVDFLRALPGVDPARVGVYAESEGCWVAPIMMAAGRAPAFQVWVSAPVVPPRQQAAYAMDNYLRNTEVPDGVFRAIPRAVGMRLPGGGFEYADFEIGPWLDRQERPILMAYGARDPSMPMEQAVRRILADTPVGADASVTVRFYGGANHGINVSDEPLGDDVVPHGDDLHLHPGFARDVATWIHALPEAATARPQVAGDVPHQPYRAAPVPRPQWYGDGDAVLAVLLGAGGALLVGACVLAAAARRRRAGRIRAARAAGAARAVRTVRAGRETRGDLGTPYRAPILSPGLGRPLALMAGAVVATAGGLVWYLLAVSRIARDYEHDALVVQGGWIGVRAVGLIAVVAAAVLVLRCRDVAWRVVPSRATDGTPDDGPAGWRLVTTAFWLVAAGATVLGLGLAYWGVYQLGV